MRVSAQDHNALFLTENIQTLQKATSENSLKASVKSISKNVSSKQQQELYILQKLFLGNMYREEADSLNAKSSKLYEEAATLASNSKNIPLQIWVYTQTGFYFYTYNQYETALPFFLKSSRLLDNTPDVDLIEGIEVLKRNAYFFGTILEHEKSIRYLTRALNLTNTRSKDYATLLNGIGSCYLDLNELSKAESYLLKAQKSALENKDTLRYAKVLGDLARIDIKRKNWEQAEKLLHQDISLSEQAGSDRNTMFARVQLGKMYWKKGDIPNSYQILTQAQQYAASKTYLKGFEQEAVETLLKIAIQQNNSKAELDLRRKLDTLNVIVKQNEGEEAINRVALKIQKEKVQWQLEAEKEKLEKASLLQWTWTIVSMLLAVIAVLIYRSYKRKLKLQMAEFNQKLLSFQYEKIQSEKKLAETHNSVEAYKTYLIEKTQQVKRLEEVISTMKNQSQNTANKKTNALEQLLSSHLMTDENWNLFKQAFIAEQPDYYNDLLDSLPDVTESNLRIILLQRMGLNNQEIAGVLGVTVDAVKKAKQRLRKKYKNTADFFI